MVRLSLDAEVLSVVKHYITLANKHYGQNMDVPSIRYDVQGSTSGQADAIMWRIHLNPILLAENMEKFMTNTIPHEVAHLVDRRVNGIVRRGNGKKRSIHGPTWRKVMELFGVSADRCHDYNDVNARVKYKTIRRHNYKCSTCETTVVVGSKSHAKMQRNQHVIFTIRKCGHEISGADFVSTRVVQTGAERRALAERQARDTSQSQRTLSASSKALGAVITFPSNVPIERAQQILKELARHGMINPTEVNEYDPNTGGPVWYIP